MNDRRVLERLTTEGQPVRCVRPNPGLALTTSDDRPSLFGQAFQGPMPGHGAWGMPVHYDLHVWVAEENPVGLFTMFNPDIACA